MSTHGDSRRSIAAWLEAEAADRAPTRLIEASRERIRTTPQRTAWWPARRGSSTNTFAKLAITAAAVIVAAFGVAGLTQPRGPVIGPAASTPSPTPQPSVATPSSAVDDLTSGGMWPQSTDEEVRQAQERADAGDPAYTWQVDPKLSDLDLFPGDVLTTPEIVDRFLREVLGWDEFLYNVRESNPEQFSGSVSGLVYIRCAPGETNPLYPIADTSAPGAERCAPTIDGLRHESVSIHIDQPEQKGPDAIWVVSDWAMTAPFAQVDPRVAETEVTAQLEEWLAARIAGQGAEGKVDTEDDRGDGRCDGRFDAMCRIDEVPLLYATTLGAPYERYEIDRVGGPTWPYAEMAFRIRLFADDGATVVEQPILWIDTQALHGGAGPRLLSTVTEMTENGQPVAVRFGFPLGKVTASAARPWRVSHHTFNYGLSLNDQYGGERVTFVPNPLPVSAGCQVGPDPADASALAQSIRSDSSFEATAPVDVIVGGAEGLRMDVTLAPGASICPDQDGRSSVVYPGRWGAVLDHGSRMRLYLIDLPEGSATWILAIAIAAPESRFESVLEAAAPVVDSIEFHLP